VDLDGGDIGMVAGFFVRDERAEIIHELLLVDPFKIYNVTHIRQAAKFRRMAKKTLKFAPQRKRLGQELAKRRRAMDITQEALGFEIEMDRTYISDIETGKRNPSLINILKLCKALKISAAELFRKAGL
jgi:DNA-binding XRE family transcriptional regulator